MLKFPLRLSLNTPFATKLPFVLSSPLLFPTIFQFPLSTSIVGRLCVYSLNVKTEPVSPWRWSVRSRLLRSGAGPSWGLICKMRVNVLIHSSMSCSLSAASTKYVTSFIFSSKACFLRRLFCRGMDGRMDRIMWSHNKTRGLVHCLENLTLSSTCSFWMCCMLNDSLSLVQLSFWISNGQIKDMFNHNNKKMMVWNICHPSLEKSLQSYCTFKQIDD